MSVRYAEELNSGKSLGTLQRTDQHLKILGVWAKSPQIFKSLCENGKQSVRQIAQKTGFPKTVCIVSSKRGHVEAGVGTGASGDRAEPWEHEGVAAGEVQAIFGAVDETFLERMILVFMDMVSDYLLFEEVIEYRIYTFWNVMIYTRLKALRVGVLYLVSDRAKALLKLAVKGLACLSIPDVLHLIHERVKSYSLALCGPLRQAWQALNHARNALATCQASQRNREEV